MSTGARVRKIRETKGWSQDSLAEKAKISKSYLSEIENNKTSPGGQTLLQVANALGATVDYLLQGNVEPSNAPQTAIVIPLSLSKAAEELKLSHSETLDLLSACNSVFAHRSDKQAKEPSVEDWKKLHEAIKEVFG
jgi:transcriptional regulator with XRE-family HTH domain